MFKELAEPDFGGEEELLLQGDCRLDCDVLDDLEYCLDIDMGTDRCAGEPTMKSDPGEVDKDGPSDLEHSETFLERQDVGLEHSELLRDRAVL